VSCSCKRTLFLVGETARLAVLSTSSEWQRKKPQSSASRIVRKQQKSNRSGLSQAAEQSRVLYQGRRCRKLSAGRQPRPHRKSQRHRPFAARQITSRLPVPAVIPPSIGLKIRHPAAGRAGAEVGDL